MMTIAQIMEKMIAFSEGNIHDIYAPELRVDLCQNHW